jgi:hypothetical protein
VSEQHGAAAAQHQLHLIAMHGIWQRSASVKQGTVCYTTHLQAQSGHSLALLRENGLTRQAPAGVAARRRL